MVLYNRENYGAYTASKILLESIVKTLSKEDVLTGNTFYIVRMSVVDSTMAKDIVYWQKYGSFDEYINKHLNGNILKADDVAKNVLNFVKEINTTNKILTLDKGNISIEEF